MTPEELIAVASEARARAYAPYSEFRVGAAVVAGGQVFTGCNVENASYGLTVCAERVAVFKAVEAGHTKIDEVAVVSGPGASACGACRQVLREFASSPQMPVHLGAADGSFRTRTMEQLLPESFGRETLQADGE